MLDRAELCGGCGFEGKKQISSTIHIYDKYKEPPEKPEVVAKTADISLFKGCLAELMRIITDGYVDKTRSVSIKGVHPSIKMRRLIDLRQSMNITSAFEHHVRRFMPEISSNDTIQTYEEIKKLIVDEYIEKTSGKKKKVAKEILKSIAPSISLGDKVKKAISGYSKWEALEEVISDRFPDWENLAEIVNQWRNELAHETREIMPTTDTIRAVRLVEHLNYAIILRMTGCENEQIKRILREILVA